jgi:hypothetical protein
LAFQRSAATLVRDSLGSAERDKGTSGSIYLGVAIAMVRYSLFALALRSDASLFARNFFNVD